MRKKKCLIEKSCCRHRGGEASPQIEKSEAGLLQLHFEKHNNRASTQTKASKEAQKRLKEEKMGIMLNHLQFPYL